jgi:hypothetical protein
MRKILLTVILCSFILILSVSYLSATTNASCEYHNHKGCKVTANTIVEGIIKVDNNAVGNAQVKVTCSHELPNSNIKNYTLTTHSVNSGKLKGTYIVTFPQSHCIDGDSVTVVAKSRNGAIGTNTGTVANSIAEKCLDLDVVIVDIIVPIVPEFGAVAGVLTVLGAIGLFFVVRRK